MFIGLDLLVYMGTTEKMYVNCNERVNSQDPPSKKCIHNTHTYTKTRFQIHIADDMHMVNTS